MNQGQITRKNIKTAAQTLEDVRIYGRRLSEFLLPDQVKFLEEAMHTYAKSYAEANPQTECTCTTCTKAVKLLGPDPGAFESLAIDPRPRLMDDSPLWNDGGNVPPGVNEEGL